MFWLLLVILKYFYVDVIFLGREYMVFRDYYQLLYVSVCTDENDKWDLGKMGLWGGQAVPGHSFSVAPLSN